MILQQGGHWDLEKLKRLLLSEELYEHACPYYTAKWELLYFPTDCISFITFQKNSLLSKNLVSTKIGIIIDSPPCSHLVPFNEGSIELIKNWNLLLTTSLTNFF